MRNPLNDVPDIMTYKFRNGKHAGRNVRAVLDIDPAYIWEDWKGGSQSVVKNIRKRLIVDCLEEDDDAISVAETTDETDDVCPIYLEWVAAHRRTL